MSQLEDKRKEALLESHDGDGWGHAVNHIMGLVHAEEVKRNKNIFDGVMWELRKRVIFVIGIEGAPDIYEEYRDHPIDFINNKCVELELENRQWWELRKEAIQKFGFQYESFLPTDLQREQNDMIDRYVEEHLREGGYPFQRVVEDFMGQVDGLYENRGRFRHSRGGNPYSQNMMGLALTFFLLHPTRMLEEGMDCWAFETPEICDEADQLFALYSHMDECISSNSRCYRYDAGWDWRGYFNRLMEEEEEDSETEGIPNPWAHMGLLLP